jgi:glycosyltransferase involved in cell wall biosynthesis
MTRPTHRIAMMGTKGVPAKWGGIETYIEEVGKRLVQRGHDVTVFASGWYRSDYREKTWLGMKIRSVPTLHYQSTDALCNGFLSALLVMKGDYDVAHFHGHGSYYFIPLARRGGKAVVVTVHQTESAWDNPKYGSFGQRFIRSGFIKGLSTADRITTVASHLQRQLTAEFGVSSVITSSGIQVEPPSPPGIIAEKYGLGNANYFLFLGRIDPIKRIDWLLDLAGHLPDGMKIAIAGAAQDPTTLAYLRGMQEKCADKSRCVFTGAAQGQEKLELLSNCHSFIMPSGNEGLPVTLLEAMSFGKCCLASDIPAHMEIVEDGTSGLLFKTHEREDLLRQFKRLLATPASALSRIGATAKERVLDKYNWDLTTDMFERVYREAVEGQAAASHKRY